MKRMRRGMIRIAVLIAFGALLTLGAAAAPAGSEGSAYSSRDIDDVSYWSGDEGAMVTDWTMLEGEWYYFDAGGARYDGWLPDRGDWYYIENGQMFHDGPLEIDDQLYYFGEDGRMRTSWVRDDPGETDVWGNPQYEWYYFDPNGAGHNGWLYDGGKWYVIDQGEMFRGGRILGGEYVETVAIRRYEDGKVYQDLFDSTGAWQGTVELHYGGL